ncbi:MAG: putative metal-binding motif-containing protein [Myxococcota bacterium]
MRRYVLAAVVLTLFAASTACKDDPAPTEIDVEIFSSVAHLDRIHLMVRDQSIDRDRGYTWAELDVANVGDRDLTITPALVRLTQSEALRGKPFLLYATGFVADATSGTQRLTVAGAITMQYAENQRLVKRVRLNGDFLATDRDDDGFRACGSFTPPTDPAEQNVLDDAKNCDCNDNNNLINGFNAEICGDNADNNCTGWPYDENCADCVEDQPCTSLPPEQWLLAGVGACTLGVYRCVSTVVDGLTVRRLNNTCEGAQGPTTEVVDGRDNDCDGVADELTPCFGGTPPRACFMGFIETEASTRAKGECRVGEQRCTDGVWENQCRNEVRPQRPPRDTLEQDNALPIAWSGIGFFELAIPSRGVQQCDGRDNDCDGFYDEEPTFDFDNDGYTYCGTNDAPPTLPRQHTAPGTAPINIDCADNNAAIHPNADERCDDNIDNDCSCDHGSAISGTGGVVSGVDCFNPDTYLDCSRTERVSTPSGTCDETTGGVFYARYGNLEADPQRRFGCFPCRASYGLTCGADGASCSAKSEACCVAGACPLPDTLTSAGGGGRGSPVFRPFCAEPDAGSCTCTVGPSWHGAAANTEPNNGGVLLDDRDDCGAIDCTPYFFGVDPADGRCYTRADIPSAEAFCLGKPLCAPAVVNPDCCTGETGQNCCQTPPDRCPSRDVRGPEHAAGRTTCMQVTPGTCQNQAVPTYQPVPANTDPFNDCAGGLNCNGSGACYLPQGDTCSGAGQCNTGLTCVDNRCCGSSACGECQACNIAGSEGTCAAHSNEDDPGTCDSDCTVCASGTCATRGNGDTTECGNCATCQGGTGACVGITAAEGKGCNDDCTSCSSGSCVNRGGGDTTECNSCQQCNAPGGNCVGITAAEGKNCNDACSSCSSGTCTPRGAGETAECGTCQACNVAGGDCVGVTADDGNNCNSDCNFCNAGSCSLRGADTGTECPACQRCDGGSTSCQSVTASEGPGCSGQCTFCNGGSCQGRGVGDFVECTSECTACSGPGGSCVASTGTGGPMCAGGGSFCCNGNCESPGAELGAGCGTGECTGAWQCSGTTAICSSMGNDCDTCSGDTEQDRLCDGSGTCGGVISSTGCPTCQTCQSSGGNTFCSPIGFNTDDNTSPGFCSGTETCDGGGNCLSVNGENCSQNSDCLSGCCDNEGSFPCDQGGGSTCR